MNDSYYRPTNHCWRPDEAFLWENPSWWTDSLKKWVSTFGIHSRSQCKKSSYNNSNAAFVCPYRNWCTRGFVGGGGGGGYRGWKVGVLNGSELHSYAKQLWTALRNIKYRICSRFIRFLAPFAFTWFRTYSTCMQSHAFKQNILLIHFFLTKPRIHALFIVLCVLCFCLSFLLLVNHGHWPLS